MAEPDLSKIVSTIMENPSLIEEIKGLLDRESKEESIVAEKHTPSESNAPAKTEEIIDSEATKATSTKATYNTVGRREHRKELLYAIKPYLSQSRAKAIDTMISIVDIIDMMNAR